jgi:heme exporter protein C
MREKLLYAIALVAAVLLARNLYVILIELPDEVRQGHIWRIFTFHFPAAIVSFSGFFFGMAFGLAYLWKRNLRWDAMAAAINEVSFALAVVTLVTGSIWAKIIWGVWWAWDPRMTSYFICLLIYSGYLMLRRVVEEPTMRARLSAVLAVFGFVDIVIVWKSIEWWNTLHPKPVVDFRTGGAGAIDPAMQSAAYWNILAIGLLSLVLIATRMRQEQTRRELDAMRRLAHTV